MIKDPRLIGTKGAFQGRLLDLSLDNIKPTFLFHNSRVRIIKLN